MIRSALRFLLAALACCVLSTWGPVFPFGASCALGAEPPGGAQSRRVFVLHSFGRGSNRTDGLAQGLSAVLFGAGVPIQETVEYLDVSRLGRLPEYPAILEARRGVMAATLAAAPPDVVVLTDRQAMEFWAAGGDALAPRAPVVFCGVEGAIPDSLRSKPGVTGVVERPGFGPTLEAARRLLPRADKVLVLGEKALAFEVVRTMLTADMAVAAKDLAVEYFASLDITQAEERLAALGPEWIVFVVGRLQQGARQLTSEEAARRVCAASPVPVFAMWNSWMGNGPVGGKIINPGDQGAAAGRLVLDILQGGAAAAMPAPVLQGGAFVFDHAALTRFGLNERLLPPGSVILNKPPPFSEAHRDLVWLFGAVTATFMGVAAVLAFFLHYRRKAQATLSAQVAFMQTLIDSMPVPVFYKDLRGVYVGCNTAFEELMGIGRDRIIGFGVQDVYEPEDAALYQAKDDELLAGGPVQIYEAVKTNASGKRRIIFHKAVYRDQSGRPAGFVGVALDVTDLRRAESELERVRAYLQAIIDSSPSAMLCMDENGAVTHANAKARKTCGECSLSSVGADFASPEELLGHVRRSITEGRTLILPRRTMRSGSEFKAEDVMIYPLHALGLKEAVVRIDDVTERHRMEELVVQSEKMMSVGGLAAGMAHEINNPLGGIMQSAQVALTRMREDLPVNRKAAEQAGCDMQSVSRYLEAREIPHLLDGLRDSARRAAAIVNNMLEFSKRSSSAWLPVEVNGLAEKALELCLQDYNLTGHFDFRRIDLKMELDPSNPAVPCSGAQIQQVAFNLLQNAAQALHEAKTPNPAITLRTLVKDACVVIEVEDNGPGMSEETRRKVFEPFFTTKEPGLGTGLGLSVSYFIVRENHGGDIEVFSELGKGSTFVVSLPLKGKRCH
jgi:PAS domain S-box-containing protein